MDEPTPPDNLPAPRRNGPAPRNLDAAEREGFLRLIRGGMGVHLACESLGIGHRRYVRTCRQDRTFRRDVDHALKCCHDRLVAMMHRIAVGDEAESIPPDVKALQYMIARADQAARYREERRAAEKAARAADRALSEAAAEFPELDALASDELSGLLHTLGRLAARKALPTPP